MSQIGSPKVQSNLPEDLDEAVRFAQKSIVNLRTEIELLEANKSRKKKEWDEEENKHNVKFAETKEEDRIVSISLNLKKEKLSTLDVEIANRTKDLNDVLNKIENSKLVLVEIEKESSDKINELKKREDAVNKKESAVVVYANSLEEKERKINKYLAIFDNMKASVIRD